MTDAQPNPNTQDSDTEFTCKKHGTFVFDKKPWACGNCGEMMTPTSQPKDVGFEEALDAAVRVFLKARLPELYAHLVDSDDNDGEFMRRAILQAHRQEQRALLERLKTHSFMAANSYGPDGEAVLVTRIDAELERLGGAE